jgi:hypothetical protein
MKYLKIQNNGELDIRLVALMGGTTKANDAYKIGQFGTGLKYTLAYLYRNNLDFKIFSGTEEVKIHLENETIRGENFEIICINGQRTSITTRMGEDWTAWMIVRELWCNALDEGGALYEVTTEKTATPGTTSFYIQVDIMIQEVLNNWHKYFIHGQEPLYKDDVRSIYPGNDRLRIYKQGVLIFEHSTMKSLFNYDVANATLNELREFKGTVNYEIAHALQKANDKVAQYFLENISPEYWEGSDHMDFDWFTGDWSKSWTNVIGNAKIVHKKAVENAAARGIKIDTAANIVVPEKVYKILTSKFEGIGALRVASKANEFLEHYDPIMENKVQQAMAILESCDYVIHPDLTIVYGFFENKRTLACVNFDERKIYVSNTLLQHPLFETIAMLIEENEHFNTGLTDETREFQQHFINLYTRTLLSKNQIEI